ncbi:hypothetical protein [Timonella sp. A28]|uniref:hypothetical protein n=1 Tax=Timonella sp. A28 TaxID=3442640 RepID=UPI003EB7D9D5
MSVEAAAASGDERELLVAMRNKVAKTLDDERTLARDLAALTKRLREITQDIAALDAREEQEGGDGAEESPDEEWADDY